MPSGWPACWRSRPSTGSPADARWMSAAAQAAASRRCSPRASTAERLRPVGARCCARPAPRSAPTSSWRSRRSPSCPTAPAVDLVTAINDVVNYVAPDDLDAADHRAGRLACAAAALLLFDANTRAHLRQLLRLDVLPHRRSGCSSSGRACQREPATALTHRADLHAFAARRRSAGSLDAQRQPPRPAPPPARAGRRRAGRRRPGAARRSRASAMTARATPPATRRSTPSGSTSHAFHDPENRKEDVQC